MTTMSEPTTGAQSLDEARAAATAANRSSRAPLWFLGIVAVLVVVGFLIHSASGGTDSLGYQVDSKRVCQNFVKDELKSPASAKFSDVTTTGSGTAWTVGGNVDSDNSFGAPIRNAFSCSVTYDETTTLWTLTSLTGLTN